MTKIYSLIHNETSMCGKVYLGLDEQVGTGHLLGLLHAHGSENGRSNITQDTALLEAPALRGVGHNEGNLVKGVGGLGGALLVEHLLGVSAKCGLINNSLEWEVFLFCKDLPVISGDEQNVVVLLASLVDLANGLVSGSNTLDGGLVHASVANHVRRGEVVHDKVELVLAKAFSHLGTDSSCTHLWVKIVGSNSG